jgi:hypothetical protein
MKRVFVLAILPLVLFGLETVNLIKDAGFEKDSGIWQIQYEADGEFDSTVVNPHDSEKGYENQHSGSIDTRNQPEDNPSAIEGRLVQASFLNKTLNDLDSLEISHLCLFSMEGIKPTTWGYGIRITFVDSEQYEAIYLWLTPGSDPIDDTQFRKVFPDTIGDEDEWFLYQQNIREVLVDIKGLPSSIKLDSFMVFGYGNSFEGWRGQKAFFDGIRLMGYADYDVGVKEILSGDSLEVGTPYQPVARIKNFGRENADSFLVIAEIKDGSSLIYVDTLPWSLDGDTEDTVTFVDFDPPTTGTYTLTVRTHMEPDECDEDDEVSKEIGHTAIVEPVTPPDGLSLEVRSIASPLQVSYSLPYGEFGTLTLYDATGRRIERMAVTRSGSVEFDSALTSGVYLVRLESKQATVIKKAVVLR